MGSLQVMGLDRYAKKKGSKNHEKISKMKKNIRTIDLHYIHC